MPGILNLMNVLKAVSMARHGRIIFNIKIIFIKNEKMGFTKKDNIYRITRMTGNRDNILGVSFGNKDSIEVIEWYFPNSDKSIIRTSKEEVLEQVLSGLNSINQSLGTSYQLSKIYYVPSEDGSSLIYQTLIRRLINHYHEGKEFKEI
jgi:hypothetical protein